MHAPAPAVVPQADPVDPTATHPPQPVEPLPAMGEIQVSRTLVKSQPELEELVASDPRFAVEGMAVSMTGRGFGTMVTISADTAAGITQDHLAEALAGLAEPQRRPFTNT